MLEDIQDEEQCSVLWHGILNNHRTRKKCVEVLLITAVLPDSVHYLKISNFYSFSQNDFAYLIKKVHVSEYDAGL